MAMLIHTFIESMMKYAVIKGGPIYVDPRLFDTSFQDIIRRRRRASPQLAPVFRSTFSSFCKNYILTPTEKRDIMLPEELRNAVFETVVKDFESGFKELFVEEIERIFGCDISDLCKHDNKCLRVCFQFNGYQIGFKCEDNKTELTLVWSKPNIIYSYKIERAPTFEIKFEKDTVRLEFSRTFFEMMESRGLRGVDPSNMILSETFEAMERLLLRSAGYLSFYLPAARSGILSTHKVMASGLLRQLPYVGLRKMEFLQLSGTITDFLANIIQLQRRRGEFFKLAELLEHELVEGKIDIKEDEKITYPEIFYRTKHNRDLPLHRSSSMVSEIAPLVLYLKYILVKGSRLVIEEPESHLHPAAQRKLAKILARLSRENVGIIMTSHSDYLLHQIQNLVFLSTIAKEKLSSLGYAPEECLMGDSVSVYLFKSLETEETIIQPVDICEESLENSGFNDIVKELYEESVKIGRAREEECRQMQVKHQ
jgi:hypothetical protein